MPMWLRTSIFLRPFTIIVYRHLICNNAFYDDYAGLNINFDDTQMKTCFSWVCQHHTKVYGA